jgi:hypothetical protein
MFRKPWSLAMLAALGPALAPSAVFAHVTLEQQQALAGAPYKIILRVPHGCGDAATIRLSVKIPEGVIAIKPMVKPGWQIDTTRGPYSKAYSYFHDAKFTEGVKEVTWSGGKLPDAFYDEFVLSAFIAGELEPGQTLYFPVVQQCEQGEHRWIEIPAADKHSSEPAPGVTLTPKK